MPTQLTRQAETVLSALRRHLAVLPRAAAPAITDGHEARWRAQQQECGEREQALYQLRALGWPSA
jgi:hypothetical protein